MSGRVAIVTGASGGIGNATCRALADGGYDVVAAVHRADARSVAMARNFRVVQMDVTNVAEVDRVVTQTADSLGGINLLVNSAGVCEIGDVGGVDLDSWRRTFDVNLFGTLTVTKAVLGIMLASGGGKIINISSQAARLAEAHNGSYAASKAALGMLTRTLALELAGSGVTVNSVAPGPVDTAMLRSSAVRLGEMTGTDGEAVLDAYRRATLEHRLLAAEEVAAVVAFLAGDAASGICGADLPVTLGAGLW